MRGAGRAGRAGEPRALGSTLPFPDEKHLPSCCSVCEVT